MHLGELTIIKSISSEDLPQTAVAAWDKYKACRTQNDLKGALVAINEAISTFSTSWLLFHDKAHLLLNMGRLEEAIEAQEKALEISPWNRDLWLNYSLFLSKVGRHNEAIQASQKAIRMDPESPVGWLSLARKYHAAKDIAQARDAFQHAVRLSHPYSWALLQAQDLIKELAIDGPLMW